MSIPVHFNGSLLNIMAGGSSGGIPSTCPSPTTILTQAFDNTGAGYISQFDTAGGGLGDFSKSYENFSFVHGALVTDVHWTGGIQTPGGEDAVTGWTIQFWTDNAGQPGTLIQGQDFLAAAVTAVHIGVVGPIDAFAYSVNVTQFIADAGVTFWISIQAQLRLPEEWFWATAGAGTCWQVLFGAGASQPNNLALDLTGCLGS